MKPAKAVAACLLLLIFVITSHSSIQALSCAPSSLSPEEHFEVSEYVFIGTVAEGEVIDANDSLLDPATVMVAQEIKGSVPDTVIIQQSNMWDTVGLNKGEEYLFLFDTSDFANGTFNRSDCDFDNTVLTSSDQFEDYKTFIDTQKTKSYTPMLVIPAILIVIIAVLAIRLKKDRVKNSDR